MSSYEPTRNRGRQRQRERERAKRVEAHRLFEELEEACNEAKDALESGSSNSCYKSKPRLQVLAEAIRVLKRVKSELTNRRTTTTNALSSSAVTSAQPILTPTPSYNTAPVGQSADVGHQSTETALSSPALLVPSPSLTLPAHRADGLLARLDIPRPPYCLNSHCRTNYELIRRTSEHLSSRLEQLSAQLEHRHRQQTVTELAVELHRRNGLTTDELCFVWASAAADPVNARPAVNLNPMNVVQLIDSARGAFAVHNVPSVFPTPISASVPLTPRFPPMSHSSDRDNFAGAVPPRGSGLGAETGAQYQFLPIAVDDDDDDDEDDFFSDVDYDD